MVRQCSSAVEVYHGIRRCALGALWSGAAKAAAGRTGGQARNKREQPVFGFV
jgi:hypothetical protein